MSARSDDRRRDYGRDDRGARGGGDRDRRPSDRRDYRDDRRDRDRDYYRDDRRRDDRRDLHGDDRRDSRDHGRERREPPKRDERDRETSHRPTDHGDNASKAVDKRLDSLDGRQGSSVPPTGSEEPKSRPTSEVPTGDHEEGETMEQDAQDDEEAAMMAMMGLPVQGFGTTKGKHVDGNQDGGADVKKIRTWRQYMNRRGGFNRPLDKIK
ncbi:DUF1777-domain-containing protein [Phanerochaete sordida]|uniref:DUF1777-domain-containing protein n=1 Tax=Phanerochaete sordida TaxID=48140 RepID=A0A9P3G3D8_9APHY|nr:DUF1777-domain-containing protein [Phanerochaete sordida]